MADSNLKIDTTLLDGLIVGRVEPHIYAFSTETVPNYLKVGDTARGVRVRLDEWRKIFPNLVQQYEHSAQIDDETIFRDFAVHTFLEQEKGRTRLLPDTFGRLPYYSKEFFEGATTADLEEAISDIYQSAREKNGKYQFYSPDRLPQTFTYERTESYPPRANQQQVIDNFRNAATVGRTNLLLYAIMRFGKSFTAMCCAKEMDAKIVVVVSAKADVKQEWKKTVESHVYFAGYKFLDSTSLNSNETIVSDALAAGDKVALFLTLQDLQGEEIKAKHKEVFEHQIDLLIVDETHFGARGASYGKVLQQYNLSKSQIEKELRNIDGFETLDQVDEAVKVLNAKIRIHLSGTPYRILMSDEFKKEDIIAFVQFTDIIDAQKQWDDEHLKEDDCNEWDNPYYGFPQMIRFAFNPNVSSVKKMKELRKNGITYAFSELFRPHSMTTKRDGSHRQFLHEPEILDLLEVIDGTKEDENLLGFLDYDKIKDGKMCRHIVVALPFRASCDAMAALIQREKNRFKNLCDYEVINIAGFDEERKYATTDIVKGKIKTCEENGRKTLTLTVNRMLTGTTVPQWDTMLYLKGTSSPQEYDQAIFRLQNQYVTTFKDENGRTIKYNMKPQTLLVDFDPNRMFRLQELKSQFYNVNTEVQGNAGLRERIAKELAISPIIVLNKHKLQEATPTNITDAVREYSRNRSVLDEASEIRTDSILLEDTELLNVLREIAPIDAKYGLQIKPTEGDGDDIDTPDTPDTPEGTENRDAEPTDQPNQHPDRPNPAEEDDKLDKRLAAYYARILFFAFLTDSTVKSLEEVIAAIPQTSDNRRIANHLGLDRKVLEVIQEKSNPFILHDLDYKIENTNDLIRDAALRPMERVEIAMRRFGRLSDSEIVTPAKVADEMVAILPFEELREKADAKFLDIASKEGEFSVALYRRFGEKVKPRLYAITTSTLAYEFTRKVYTLLGMPVENIYADFTSYDLIGENNNEIIKQLTDMRFDVIIGNPPYQDKGGSGGTNDASIYQNFCQIAFDTNPNYTSMIIPSRWYTGGRENLVGEFRNRMLTSKHVMKLVSHTNAKDLFPNAEIKGGCCYFLYAKSYCGKCEYELNRDGVKIITERDLGQFNILVREPILAEIVERILSQSDSFVDSLISSDTPFGIPTNPKASSKSHIEIYEQKDKEHEVALYWIKRNRRCIGYISRESVKKNVLDISRPKVFIPEAYGAGESFPHQIIGIPEIASADSACSQSYLYVAFGTKTEVENFAKYLHTKFLRVLVSASKVSQHAMSKVYRFVPVENFTAYSDIDWSKSIPEIDTQLYAKYGLTAEEIDFIESMIKPME